MLCKRILIVEDDDVIRESLQQILQGQGYPVHTAVDGSEAIDRLAEMNSTCLVLLDLMMPVMNGWEFLKRRMQDEKLLHLPVVVFSANGDSSAEIRSHRAEFLRKPIRMEHLYRIVEKYCGKPPKRAQ